MARGGRSGTVGAVGWLPGIVKLWTTVQKGGDMRRLLSVLLVVLVVGGIAPAVVSAAPVRMSPDCAGWISGGGLHHELSPWTAAGMANPAVSAKVGLFVIYGFTVTACGGQWMFAKTLDSTGGLVTNFLTSKAYVMRQMHVAAAVPVVKAVAQTVTKAVAKTAVAIAMAPSVVLPVVVAGPDALCKWSTRLCPPGTVVLD